MVVGELDSPDPPPAPGSSTPGPPVVDDAVLAAVVRASVNPYAILGDDGTVLFVSEPIEQILGFTAEQCVGRSVLDFISPPDRDDVITAIAEFADPHRLDDGWTGPPISVDLLHAAGQPVPCRVLGVGSPRNGFPGTVVRIRQTGTVSSLDALMAAMATEPDLRRVMELIVAAISEQTPESHCAVGLGWTGSRFRDVITADTVPLLDGVALPTDGANLPWLDAISRCATQITATAHLEHPIARVAAEAGHLGCWAFPIELDGACEDVLVVWRPVAGPPARHIDEATTRMVQVAQLALTAHHSRRALEHRARTDPLTGLANRLALFDRLDELARTGTASSIGVLYCDLDDFKPINDRFGHATGDRVLTIAAHRISSQLRSADLVARLGGDEFAILCVGADAARLAGLARRLVRAFAEPIVIEGQSVHVGISVGSAMLDSPGRGWLATELLHDADGALLAAKADGKGTWRSATR